MMRSENYSLMVYFCLCLVWNVGLKFYYREILLDYYIYI